MTFLLSVGRELSCLTRRPWRGGMAAALGLLLGLMAVPSIALAQNQDADCFGMETVAAQLNTRGYTFGCVPENWNLYRLADDAWYRGAQSLAGSQIAQQRVFISQFRAGHYDDYVVGDPPAWQAGAALEWQRDFAGVGYRRVEGNAQAIPVFFLAMWAGGPLAVDSLATALAAQADNYETVALPSLTLRYLDGEDALPPQTAYVLNGRQMQSLFNLDTAFLNSTYVIVPPTAASHTLAGVPVFAFFSSSPIASSDLETFLQSLLFRPRLPPSQPDPAQVTRLQTPLGLLELVPELQAAAAALVAERRAAIREEAVAFAQDMPYTNLLPFQLLTSDVNLYWAPSGMKTGRLILWYYAGGAHGNYAVASWTFTALGAPVALPALLAVTEEEALTLILEAAIEHLRNSPADMTEEEIESWVLEGLTGLDVVSAWNPVIRNGREGLWITLEPYVITPYYLGVQEFFVPMALQDPE